MDRKELVAGLRSGNDEAWRLFVQEYGKLMYAVASRVGLDGDERDDLFQNTCIAAVRSIRTLRDPAKLSSWVYGVAYRLALHTVSRRRPAVSLEDIDDGSTLAGEIAVPAAFEEELIRLERVAQLQDALHQLGGRCQRLLTAFFLEDPRPDYQELARREKMPIGSLGPTRARCFDKLRKIMAPVSDSRSTSTRV